MLNRAILSVIAIHFLTFFRIPDFIQLQMPLKYLLSRSYSVPTKLLQPHLLCSPSRKLFHLQSSFSNLSLIHCYSTSGHHRPFGSHIECLSDASKMITRLTIPEKKFVFEALKTEMKKKEIKFEVENIDEITPKQTRQLIIFNVFPFIGFGILDNMILIVAGQYINTTFGVLLGISTMAAAALGNIVSDIAGVGLSYYIEIGVRKLGLREPSLIREQSDSRRVRFIINCSRAIGLTIGCLIGMFPLLFYTSGV